MFHTQKRHVPFTSLTSTNGNVVVYKENVISIYKTKIFHSHRRSCYVLSMNKTKVKCCESLEHLVLLILFIFWEIIFAVPHFCLLAYYAQGRAVAIFLSAPYAAALPGLCLAKLIFPPARSTFPVSTNYDHSQDIFTIVITELFGIIWTEYILVHWVSP